MLGPRPVSDLALVRDTVPRGARPLEEILEKIYGVVEEIGIVGAYLAVRS
jgi:hypothetical protein